MGIFQESQDIVQREASMPACAQDLCLRIDSGHRPPVSVAEDTDVLDKAEEDQGFEQSHGLCQAPFLLLSNVGPCPWRSSIAFQFLLSWTTSKSRAKKPAVIRQAQHVMFCSGMCLRAWGLCMRVFGGEEGPEAAKQSLPQELRDLTFRGLQRSLQR